MFSYPSFIQIIPDPLRRLRVQKLWLLAQYMAGLEKDVTEQIWSVDEQIARHKERMRLTEEFWKIENEEEMDLDALDDLPDAASDNRFESVISAQTAQWAAMHDKNRENETERPKHERFSLLAATPSKIPAARKIIFDQQPSLRAPVKTCKIATTTTARAATAPSRDREVVSPSRHLESSLVASTHAAGSKIGRLNFLKQPGQDEQYNKRISGISRLSKSTMIGVGGRE